MGKGLTSLPTRVHRAGTMATCGVSSLSKVSQIVLSDTPHLWSYFDHQHPLVPLVFGTVSPQSIRQNSSVHLRGGGTGFLISNGWMFAQLRPLTTNTALEYHTAKITAPIKTYILIVYHPPGGSLHDFICKMDILLSDIPDNGTPLMSWET